MFKKIIMFMFFVGTIGYGYKYPTEKIHKDMDKLFSIVSDTHEISINNHVLKLDMRRLLAQTAMIESNFGRDKYRGRLAKTYLQIEEKSAKWYLSQVPELKEYIEENIGRKIKWDSDRDAMFTAYLLYMSKIQQHGNWIDKFRKSKHFKDGDLEYYVYKLFYNSIAGASKYSTWKKRENEYFDLKYKNNA